MPDLVQLDLLGAGAVIAANVPRETIAPRPARKKRLAETSLEAGRVRPESQKQSDRHMCLDALIGAGPYGLTRQDLADNLDIEIQTVCWTVAALLASGDVFEPVIDYDQQQRPVHLVRDRRKVLVARIHERAWEAQRSA